MSTVFIYDPTGFELTIDKNPEASNSSRRDLQLALFRTASGKPRAIKNKIEILRLELSFIDLCAQDEADLSYFHSQIVLDNLRQFRIAMGAYIATPIACGELIGDQPIACGQNLSELDPTLPAAPMQCGRFYHGDRTTTIPRCKFESGSYRVTASGNDQRNGYNVSFSLISEWGS